MLWKRTRGQCWQIPTLQFKGLLLVLCKTALLKAPEKGILNLLGHEEFGWVELGSVTVEAG